MSANPGHRIRMKHLLIAATLAFATPTRAWAQHPHADPVPDPVAHHRAVYQDTERHLPSYLHASAPFDTLGMNDEATEGGHLDAYCNGTTLKLLVAEFNGELGDGVDRLYFDHDSLLFVFSRVNRGIPDGVHPYPRRTIHEEQRYYFADGRLVRWIGIGNRQQSVTSSTARERVSELLAEAARFRAAMPACTPRYAPPDTVGAR